MFEIIFYKMTCEKNRIDKTQFLTEPKTYSGTLRESSSIINPVITVEEPTSALVGYNYCYIAAWNRYYFITDIVSVSNFLWEISMRVDVLNTFKTEIKQQEAIIFRTADNNLINNYIIDDLLPVSEEVKYYSFDASGFNQELGFPTSKEKSVILSVMSNSWDGQEGWVYPIYNYANAKYLITPEDLSIFNQCLINDSNYEGTKIWGQIGENPSNAIISAYLYPFHNLYNLFVKNGMPEQEQTNILVGSASFNLVKGHNITKVCGNPLVPVWHFQIQDITFENFIDCYPFSQYFLYLPFYGFVDMSREIRPFASGNSITMSIRCSMDLNSGECIYFISINRDIKVVKATIAFPLPLGRSNMADIKRDNSSNFSSFIGNSVGAVAGGIIGGLATGSPAIGAITGVSGFIKSITTYGAQSITANSIKYEASFTYGNSVIPLDLSPKLLKFTKNCKYTDKFINIYGRPSGKYSSLSAITGYTEIGEVHLEKIPNALDAELTEIETLLKSGVHF